MNKTIFSAAASGAIFAVGLAISGMTQPAKVIAFLDFFGGAWDPSLALVMGGALTVYSIGFSRISKRAHPIFEGDFHLPTRRDVDARLLVGAALFGVGWGLGGFCPGPALTSIGAGFAGMQDVLVFVAAMAAGMMAVHAVDTARAR